MIEFILDRNLHTFDLNFQSLESFPIRNRKVNKIIKRFNKKLKKIK